jgi:hypothetical protein
MCLGRYFLFILTFNLAKKYQAQDSLVFQNKQLPTLYCMLELPYADATVRKTNGIKRRVILLGLTDSILLVNSYEHRRNPSGKSIRSMRKRMSTIPAEEKDSMWRHFFFPVRDSILIQDISFVSISNWDRPEMHNVQQTMAGVAVALFYTNYFYLRSGNNEMYPGVLTQMYALGAMDGLLYLVLDRKRFRTKHWHLCAKPRA